MKKLVAFLGLLGIMALPGIAVAEDSKPMGVYVGGHLGMSIENFSGRKFIDAGSGVSWSPGSKTDTAFGGGISIGYDFEPQLGVPVRLELDYTARTRGEAKSSGLYDDSAITGEGPFDVTKKDSVSLQTLMLNAWVDIPTGTAFTPYLGGGVGFGFVNYKARMGFVDTQGVVDSGSESSSTNETNFAWSLGGGVAYDVTDNWTVDLGYRYIDAGKARVSFTDEDGTWGKSKAKVQTHDVMVGVRYTF
ncbi:MAG: porin family protein [Desulfovibrio sp.]|jgi:opacity protein-like surface antigen|nr:porin family protein [Desulfovibrio sp.]